MRYHPAIFNIFVLLLDPIEVCPPQSRAAPRGGSVSVFLTIDFIVTFTTSGAPAIQHRTGRIVRLPALSPDPAPVR